MKNLPGRPAASRARDAIFAISFVLVLAQIEAQAGQTDQALRLIALLLSIPAGGSVRDPLRFEPRLHKLIADNEAKP